MISIQVRFTNSEFHQMVLEMSLYRPFETKTSSCGAMGTFRRIKVVMADIGWKNKVVVSGFYCLWSAFLIYRFWSLWLLASIFILITTRIQNQYLWSPSTIFPKLKYVFKDIKLTQYLEFTHNFSLLFSSCSHFSYNLNNWTLLEIQYLFNSKAKWDLPLN